MQDKSINIFEYKGIPIAEVLSDEIIITETQDALDLMADIGYQGSNRIILYEKNINPGFFDLKTRIAGDILQKFSNYQVRLAIVGDFSRFPGKSIKDFIFESNKHGHICFVPSLDEAKDRLAR